MQGCEVAPDINIANSKYGIHLSVPSADGMSDLWLKCDSVNTYALHLLISQFLNEFLRMYPNTIKIHFYRSSNMPDGWQLVEWLQKEKAWPTEGMTLKSSLSKHSYLCRYINHT